MTFRKALISDIQQMQELAKSYVDEGIILPRSDDEIATNIRSYLLAVIDDKIIGFGSLYIYSKELSEIRSMIISQKFQKQGIGKKIINALINEAKELGLKEVLAFTYQKDFFVKCGFKEISKEKIPNHKVWEDCIKCKLFPTCNEIALILKLPPFLG